METLPYTARPRPRPPRWPATAARSTTSACSTPARSATRSRSSSSAATSTVSRRTWTSTVHGRRPEPGLHRRGARAHGGLQAGSTGTSSTPTATGWWSRRRTRSTRSCRTPAARAVCRGSPASTRGPPRRRPRAFGPEPRIYYGELITDYSIVGAEDGAAPREYDSDTQSYTYTGRGGVPLGNLVNRLVFSLVHGERNILFNASISDNSKIMYVRNPADQVKAVAPWLTLDTDPYPAVVDGRVTWIVDGYTTLANYPYASGCRWATPRPRRCRACRGCPTRRSATSATRSRPRSTPTTARSPSTASTRPTPCCGPGHPRSRTWSSPPRRSRTACGRTCATRRTCSRSSASC